VGDGTRLGESLALPKDGKPVATWEHPDEALASIAGGLRNLIQPRTPARGVGFAPAISVKLAPFSVKVAPPDKSIELPAAFVRAPGQRAFAISTLPVSVSEFSALAGSYTQRLGAQLGRYDRVTIDRLFTERLDHKYRLPTLEEWRTAVSVAKTNQKRPRRLRSQLCLAADYTFNNWGIGIPPVGFEEWVLDPWIDGKRGQVASVLDRDQMAHVQVMPAELTGGEPIAGFRIACAIDE
jgi:hypothetical protein